MWEIQKIKINELENYFQENPIHSNSILPISPERIQSYCANPRALPSDYAVYFIKENDSIIAFRTVWADEAYAQRGMVRFAWCSGNWVSPLHRRKGLSLLILKEINSDWEGKLMMTNYAPESLHGYLKTGLFKFKHDRLGKRFYLNVNLNKLVENRNINLGKKFGLKILNLVYQLVTKIKSGLLFKEHTLELAFAESSEYLGQNMQVTDSYFKRNHVEWNWIFKKSWLRIDENIENTNYPFSWKVKHFAYHFVSVKDEVNFVISNRNGIVKVLYWNEKNTSLTVMAKWLINYCYKNKVQTLTVIDNKLAQTIQQLRNPFVFSKPFSMNIYSTFDMNTGIGKFYDGDGDYIFT